MNNERKDHSTEQQTPHSGRHGHEQPHREYDKTPLDKAPLDYDPRKTEDLTTEHLPEDLRMTPKKERKFGKKTIASIAGGATLIAGGAFAATQMFGGEEKAPVKANQENSAPANPGEADKNAQEQEQTVEFGISAAEFENNPEALAREYYSQLNQFLIAGANKETSDADERYTMQPSEYVDSFSAEIDQKFIDELFVEGWEDKPALVSYLDTTIEVAHHTRKNRLFTYSGVEGSQEPYVREFIPDTITIPPGDVLVTNIRWHGYDNRDSNTAEDTMTGINPNEETGGSSFTWIKVGGQLKISDNAYYDE